MPALLEPKISRIINLNNPERKISTGFIPPGIDDGDSNWDGDRNKKDYEIYLSYGLIPNKKKHPSVFMEVCPNELWIPLNAFLNMAIIHNPNFVRDNLDYSSEEEEETLNSLSTKELLGKLHKERLEKGESESSMDITNTLLSRRLGYSSQREEIEDLKLKLSSPEPLVFSYIAYLYKEMPYLERKILGKDRLDLLKEYQINPTSPISELMEKRNIRDAREFGFYSIFLAFEKESELKKVGVNLPGHIIV